MKTNELHCEEVREELSARLDGEGRAGLGLLAHLTACNACRAYELELEDLRREFEALPAPGLERDLWPAIERRARPARRRLWFQAAAALVGFMAAAGAMRWLAGTPVARPEQHLLERLTRADRSRSPFAALPEYRLLQLLPHDEER